MGKDDVPKIMICGDIEILWNDLASIAYRIMSYGLLLSISGQSVSKYNTYCSWIR